MNKPVLHCENLSKYYQDGDHQVRVFDNISFALAEHSRAAIIGASGSGKSTFLHLLAGLDKPSAGEVYWREQAIAPFSEAKLCETRNKTLGFVFQFHHLLPEFDALENVMFPLLIRGQGQKEAQVRAKALLVEVGLESRIHHKPSALSGGERQRVAIARALVAEPACLLADEPTGNLDHANSEKIIELLMKLSDDRGLSLLIVTHDKMLARRMQTCYALDEGGLSDAKI